MKSSDSNELKVNGLILRETPYGDYDKILNLLTAEYGRITVSGKGIKSLKNKNMPATQLFCYSSFLLKKRGDYYYISESELIENFFGLRGDLHTLSLASYICDIVYDVTAEDNDETEMLRLTLNALYAISKRKTNLSVIKAAYEFKTAGIAGYMPDLSACGLCESVSGNPMYIDVMNGRLLCDKCVLRIREDYISGIEKNRPQNYMSFELYKSIDFLDNSDVDETGTRMIFIPVNDSIINAMRYILESRIEKFLSFTLADYDIKKFSLVCEKYLLNHLEHGFTSLEFYKTMILK